MKKKLLLNSATSLLLQVVSIVIGLILPRLIIQNFGSAVNGLVNSVSQFMSYIVLFEAGIGGVVRASLYHPLADNNNDKISSILKTADNYFKKLALFFAIYVVILAFLYPLFINNTFGIPFTSSLIVIISLSTFAQYFIGIKYSIFLQADSKNYVANMIQIFTSVLNAILMILLVTARASIHQARLVSAAIYILKPFALMLYVSRTYSLTKKCKPDDQALRQRRNGLAHHMAWFLHTNTDIAVITLVGELGSVSVYAVYYLVVNSITRIASACVSGGEAAFGRKMAEAAQLKVRQNFRLYCMIMDNIVIVLFFTASAMLIPFILLYTKGITDVNYIEPALGYCLLAAEGVYCIRIPYDAIVTAAGHFKQTQQSAFLEAGLNILLSLLLIHIFGLPGVAFATLVAMLYRTIYYIWYLSKHILKINVIDHYIRNSVCILLVSVAVGVRTFFFDFTASNYFIWITQSIVCVMCGILMALAYDLIFFKSELDFVLRKRI